MNASDDDKLIGDLLKPPRSIHASRDLQADLRYQTVKRIRAHRLPKRLRHWGSLSACYVVGILSAAAWFGISTPESADDRQGIAAEAQMVQPGQFDAVTTEEPQDSLESLPACRIELQAMSSEPTERVTLLRLAGDKYLTESDVGAATRCYAQVARWDIEHGNPANIDDSWLLTALKQSIQRRETHETGVQ